MQRIQSPQNSSNQNHPTDSYPTAIRKEIIEIREREKRRLSVVIKGLRATTTNGIAAKFAEITSMMMGTRVSITDIYLKSKTIQSSLCRAKIHDADERKLVLTRLKP